MKKQNDLYVSNMVANISTNPRDVYKYINSQKKDTQKKSRIGVTETQAEQAEELNSQFIDVFNKMTTVSLYDEYCYIERSSKSNI